jgi:hypothetical protein
MKGSAFCHGILLVCLLCDRAVFQGIGFLLRVSGVVLTVCMLCWVRADEARVRKE